jgi:hypothetical protein
VLARLGATPAPCRLVTDFANGLEYADALRDQALPWNSSRPISICRISLVPAPIS